METVFLLWIFMAQPWTFGAIPMEPGWYSSYIFEDEQDCRKAAAQYSTAMCLHPTDPMPMPLSTLRGGKA